MNTVKYSSEYTDVVEELLRKEDNLVALPSDIYFDVAELIAAETTDKTKLHKLLAKTYSFLVYEKEELLGYASIDKEGTVGIIIVKSGEFFEKAFKNLVRTLERRAEKKELTYVFVLKTNESAELFAKLGYEPFIGQEGDAPHPTMLVKKIVNDDKFDLSYDKVRRITLDPSKPIKVENKISTWPLLLFGIACFFVALLTAISVGDYVSNGSLSSNFYLFFAVVGAIFLIALAFLIAYLLREKRIKREILEEMEITNGIITEVTVNWRYSRHSDGDRERRYYVGVYYVFYDGGKKREGSFVRKYRYYDEKFFKGQEIIVAYSEDKDYLLSKYTVLDELPVKQKVNQSARVSESEEYAAGDSDGKQFKHDKKIYDISQYMSVKELKTDYLFSLILACVCVVTVASTLLVLAVLSANSTVTFATMLSGTRWFLISTAVILCGLALGYALFPLSARLKLQFFLKTDYVVVSGELVSSETTYKGKGSANYYCAYVDADGVPHKMKLAGRYAKRRVRIGKTDVLVAYNDKATVVLVKKYKLPIRLR